MQLFKLAFCINDFHKFSRQVGFLYTVAELRDLLILGFAFELLKFVKELSFSLSFECYFRR